MNLRLLSLLLVLFLPLIGFAEEDELLDPDKAFALSTSMNDTDTVIAEWTIADGYYLYRNNFNFKSETPGIEVGKARLPDGKLKNDEFFGEIEIYEHSVKAEIPLKGDLQPGKEVRLKITSQGCNEPIGVCYPPQHTQVALVIPEQAAATANPLDALKNFAASIDSSDDELLDADQAFAFTVDVISTTALEARWAIADDYYLYQDKIRFSLKDAEGNSLGPIAMPQAIEKHDEFLGDTQVYKHDLVIRIPLIREEGAATAMTLVADFQGCNEVLGVCYPPVHKEIPFSLEHAPAGDAVQAMGGSAQSPGASDELVSEQDSIAASLASGNVILTLLTFFGLGLLLAFTPCVFPMIPILSGIIIGQGEKISTGRAFSLSLAYVLAMAATYTVAGVLAGMFGANIQVWFQNPWVLGVFASIFILLSLSMFGFYELQMPSAIQSRLTEVSNKQKGGDLAGAAIMGLLSALIVGPCVTAPLVGALIYIGQTGDAVLGGAALFALSLGMGAPLLALGTSAGKLLPKAGAWMDATKAVFGVLLLGVAIWLIERVIPTAVTMALWAILLIISAIYMGALEPIKEAASGWMRLWKGVGVILLVWGAIMLVSAASGGHDLMQPLKGIQGQGVTMTSGQAKDELHFKKVKNVAELDQAIDEARANGQYVMFDFYADWCISCKEMEKYTFGDPSVQKALDNVVLLKTDVTANNANDKALLGRFGIIGPPAILFFDPSGEEKRNYRVVGFKEADEFAAHIRKLRGM